MQGIISKGPNHIGFRVLMQSKPVLVGGLGTLQEKIKILTVYV